MLASVLSLAALVPLLVAGSPAVSSRSLAGRDGPPVVFDTVTVFKTPATSLDGVKVFVPEGQTQVTIPGDEKLVQFVVGRGFQNYTCGADSKYASVGAVADFSAVGSHFFIIRDGGIAPTFEFKEALKDDKQFVVGKKTGEIDDRTDAKKNIKWLEFISIDGSLTKTFFRTNTAGGQPPDWCNHDQDKDVLTVPYAALYAFFL